MELPQLIHGKDFLQQASLLIFNTSVALALAALVGKIEVKKLGKK